MSNPYNKQKRISFIKGCLACSVAVAIHLTLTKGNCETIDKNVSQEPPQNTNNIKIH